MLSLHVSLLFGPFVVGFFIDWIPQLETTAARDSPEEVERETLPSQPD
jgi:hypothetical protein